MLKKCISLKFESPFIFKKINYLKLKKKVYNLISLIYYLPINGQIYRLRSTFFASILKQEIAWFDTSTSDGFAARISE